MMNSIENRISKSNWHEKKSELMNLPSTRGHESISPEKYSATERQPLFTSPVLLTCSRKQEWNESSHEKSKLDSLNFSTTSDLNKIDATVAARKALVPFGTTPEKLKENHSTKQRSGELITHIKANYAKKESTLTSEHVIASTKSSTSILGNVPNSSKLSNIFTVPTKDDGKSDFSSKLKSAVTSNPLLPNKSSEVSTESKTTEVKKNQTVDGFNKKSNDKISFSFGGFNSELSKNNSTTSSINTISTKANIVCSNSVDINHNNASKCNDSKKIDYHAVLTKFYQTYNASKVPDVTKTLDRYKGREIELFSKLSARYRVSNPFDSIGNHSLNRTKQVDYKSVLTEFYQKYSPNKIGDVPKRLEQYKGREEEMFSKLARKYNVPNPLLDMEKDDKSKNSQLANSSSSSMSIVNSSNSQVGFTSNSSNTFFGTSKNNAFGQKPGINAFGTPSTFGGPSISSSQKQQISSPSPFGQPSVGFGSDNSKPFSTSSTTFGSATMTSPATPAPVTFGGRTPKDILVAFYQKYNPNKVAEVDKFLMKYSGKEEQMFRNLAKKYNVDPTLFGLKNATVASPAFGTNAGNPSSNFSSPSFGQSATSGSTQFGQPSTLNNSSSTFNTSNSVSTFNTSKAQTSGFSGVAHVGGFGSLAASSPSTFGSTATTSGGGFGGFGRGSTGFGTSTGNMANNSTPFGAARR